MIDRPPQTRARLRLAAPAHADQPGRHRAGRAAAGRHRRDAASAASCRAPAPTGWRAPRRRRRSQRCKLDDELRGSYILAADTVVAVGRRILPKAELLDEAAQCLRLLSGRNHRVHTARLPGDAEGGVPPAAGRDAGALQAAVGARTSRPISPPANGAARPAATPRRGIAGSFIVKIVGSYTNVVGLPLYETTTLLVGEGYPDPLRLAQRGVAILGIQRCPKQRRIPLDDARRPQDLKTDRNQRQRAGNVDDRLLGAAAERVRTQRAG